MRTKLLPAVAALLVGLTLAACGNYVDTQPTTGGNHIVALVPAGNWLSSAHGYWEVNSDGLIQRFGNIARIPFCYKACPDGIKDATAVGDDPTASAPIWLLTGYGTVVGENGARPLGNWYGAGSPSFIVSTPGGHGYWLISRTGLVEGFGSAHSFAPTLTSGVVGGLAQSADGLLLALANGQVVALGDATSDGSCLGVCTSPVVAIVGDGTAGYWLVDAQGAVYTFGQAHFHGAGVVDNKTFVTAAAPPGGHGYWLVDSQGQVYTFGLAPYAVGDNPSVVGVGDSLAFTLTADLSFDTPIGATVYDGGILGCGIAQGEPIVDNGAYFPQIIPACSGLPGPTPWETYYQRDVAQHAPTVVLLLLGYWESVWRVVDGQWQHIGQPAYDAYLRSQLVKAIDILTAGGAHVALLTAPYVDQGPLVTQYPPPPGAPSGAETVVTNQDINEWNSLAESVATGWPTQVSIIHLHSKVDPGGQFAGSIDGLTIRAPDGIHFPFFSMSHPNQPDPDTVAQCKAFGRWIGQWLWPQVLDVHTSIKGS